MWKEWADKEEPQNEEMPMPFNELKGFQKLCVMKCFRPEKILFVTQQFITDNIGKFFVEYPPPMMESI